MNLTSPEPLVDFTNLQWNEITINPKFLLWYELWQIYNSNNYIISSKEELAQKYQNFDDWETFLLIQLKFFLIRNSFEEENKLPEKLLYWSKQLPGFCKVNSDFLLLVVQFPQFKFQQNIAMFAYNAGDFLKYIKAWTESTIDLNTWKRFRFVEVPKEVVEVASHFNSTIDFTFPSDVMRKLFDQEVLLIYERVFKPRLKDKQLSKSEKSLIERVLGLAGTPTDLKYLNRNFIRTFEESRIPDKLLRCRNGKLLLEELDIHSPKTLKIYCALLMYHKSVQLKKGFIADTKPVMYFKGLTRGSKKQVEVFEKLHDIFNRINSNCPFAQWIDYKSIFRKGGSKTKINWTGDVELLSYIFRKLGRYVEYEGGKWNVVAYYFYDNGKNKDTITAKKLPGNTHYDAAKDEKLVEPIESLIYTLSQK